MANFGDSDDTIQHLKCCKLWHGLVGHQIIIIYCDSCTAETGFLHVIYTILSASVILERNKTLLARNEK